MYIDVPAMRLYGTPCGWFGLLLGCIVLTAASLHAEEVPWSVTAVHPGGNIVVDNIEGDTVLLRTDLRDTEGWWFYWNFKVSGAQGRTLTFRFTERNPIGVRGPAISRDHGASWSWLGKGGVKGASFTYSFAENEGDVYFAFTMPYLARDLEKFLSNYQTSEALTQEQLCTSAKGRKVTLLRAGCLQAEPRYRVLLTARHHACESMASYVLEGVLAAILADTDDGAWFWNEVEVMAIPFMDTDGVEDGDQGKNRRPRDHNRDYIGESVHPEVAAVRELVPAWSDGKLQVALDLHCPYISGKHNEDIYIVGSPDAEIWKQQQAFGKLLEANATGPLPYYTSSNLPFGEAWNKSTNYTAGKSFGRWAGELEGVRLAATLEIPYANASGAAVTPESARAFGESLAKTLRIYLESR